MGHFLLGDLSQFTPLAKWGNSTHLIGCDNNYTTYHLPTTRHPENIPEISATLLDPLLVTVQVLQKQSLQLCSCATNFCEGGPHRGGQVRQGRGKPWTKRGLSSSPAVQLSLPRQGALDLLKKTGLWLWAATSITSQALHGKAAPARALLRSVQQ